jgi:hypothetical protein
MSQNSTVSWRRSLARRGPGRRLARPLGGDQMQDALARAEREIELLEVGVGELTQGRQVDFVVREQAQETLEPMCGQPVFELSTQAVLGCGSSARKHKHAAAGTAMSRRPPSSVAAQSATATRHVIANAT